jgi:hypothetical protein
LFPFCQERYWNIETGEFMNLEPTISLAGFFGLADGWPHFDQDPR